MTDTYGYGVCGARTGPATAQFCHTPLDELGGCPQAEEHWEPVCRCGNRLDYHHPCPTCGMFKPLLWP